MARIENIIVTVRVAPDFGLGVTTQLNERLSVTFMQDPVRMIPVQGRAVADYKGRYPDSRLKTSLKNGLRCFLQSTGLTKYSMWTQIIGAVTNIILDPFFIFGWCGIR